MLAQRPAPGKAQHLIPALPLDPCTPVLAQ